VIVYTLLQPTAPDERVRKRGFLIFLTCALTISLLYAFFSHRNTPHHLASLNQTLAFLFSVIGHPLFAPWVHPYNTSLPKISLCIFGGALICVIFTVLTLYSLRSQSLRNAKVINYCIALGIFSITSAILIASGRTALGLALSLETRYITFTTPLYLGIIFALGYIASQHNNRLLNIFAISFSIVILANAIAIIPAAQRYGADLRFIHSYLRDCLSLAQHLPPNFHPEQRLFQSAPPPTTMETYKHLAETHYMTITHNELNQALSTNLSSATCSSYNTISTTNGTVISGTITDPTTIHAPSLICAIQRDSNNIPKIIAINAPSRPLPEKFLSSRLGQPSNPAKWSLYLPSSISSELDIYAFDDRSQKLIFLFHWMPLTP
jgi:hypothetical protein